MAIAASLSLPPGAMFSLMFTKHRILNFCRRQEEFSAVRRNRLSDRLRGASRSQACQLRRYFPQFFNQSRKIAADCAPIEWPPQAPSTPAKQPSVEFSVCLLNEEQGVGASETSFCSQRTSPAKAARRKL